MLQKVAGNKKCCFLTFVANLWDYFWNLFRRFLAKNGNFWSSEAEISTGCDFRGSDFKKFFWKNHHSPFAPFACQILWAYDQNSKNLIGGGAVGRPKITRPKKMESMRVLRTWFFVWSKSYMLGESVEALLVVSQPVQMGPRTPFPAMFWKIWGQKWPK